MSVDDRLREAFGETDRSWDEQAPDALAAVTARRRHETVGTTQGRRCCGGRGRRCDGCRDGVPAGGRRAVPLQDPTTPATGLGGEPNPLDGTWVSQPLTRRDVRRAARLAGDASDAAAMLADLPATPFRVALYVSSDRSSMTARSSASTGGPRRTPTRRT